MTEMIPTQLNDEYVQREIAVHTSSDDALYIHPTFSFPLNRDDEFITRYDIRSPSAEETDSPVPRFPFIGNQLTHLTSSEIGVSPALDSWIIHRSRGSISSSDYSWRSLETLLRFINAASVLADHQDSRFRRIVLQLLIEDEETLRELAK